MRSSFLYLLLPLLFILSCSSNSASFPPSKKGVQDGDVPLTFYVVTPTFIPFDAVRAVVKGETSKKVEKDNKVNQGFTKTFPLLLPSGKTLFIKLTLLIKPGVEVHTYEPSIQDLLSINRANLFIHIGGESEEWITRLSSSFPLTLSCLKLFDYMQTLSEVDVEKESKDRQEVGIDDKRQEENRVEVDEHVWLSFSNERQIIKIVATVLSDKICNALSLLPSDTAFIASTFNLNAKEYIEKIGELEGKIKEVVSKRRSPLIVASRFPYLYFTTYFNLPYIAAYNGCSEAVDTNIKAVEKIASVVSKGKRSVFYMELTNNSLLSMLESDYKVQGYLLHSLQSITPAEFSREETYISIMEQNFLALDKGL